MKVLQQKIEKLEKEKSLKIRKRDELDAEISKLSSQIKELKALDSDFEKLEERKKKVLYSINNRTSQKNNEEIVHTESFSDMFNEGGY